MPTHGYLLNRVRVVRTPATRANRHRPVSGSEFTDPERHPFFVAAWFPSPACTAGSTSNCAVATLKWPVGAESWAGQACGTSSLETARRSSRKASCDPPNLQMPPASRVESAVKQKKASSTGASPRRSSKTGDNLPTIATIEPDPTGEHLDIAYRRRQEGGTHA